MHNSAPKQRFLFLEQREDTMDRVTRCLHCGKRIVRAPSYTRAHRVEVHLVWQVGPDGSTDAKGMGE